MVLSDKEIKEYVKKYQMIEPFKDSQVRDGIISFGLSSYGYDFRLADEFKIFTNVNCVPIDPKNFDKKPSLILKAKFALSPQTLLFWEEV
jgi:dCTP deaminase